MGNKRYAINTQIFFVADIDFKPLAGIEYYSKKLSHVMVALSLSADKGIRIVNNTNIIDRVNDIEPVPATTFTVIVDGKQVQACVGETILNLLFALDMRSIATTKYGQQVGAYCGMGICFCCIVCIDGVDNQRACQSIVREGMNIQTHCNRFYAVGIRNAFA